MTDLELIFTMLGEASTTEITIQQDAQGFQENKEAAQAGGKIAGNARRELEAKSGRSVVSSSNFLSYQDLEISTIKSVVSKDNES
jgi:DNA-damage-inducible protein D